MTIGDIPIFSMLRTRMQWHQERQRVLAENVSNSDTPNFRPHDLVAPKFDRQATSIMSPVLSQTDPAHISGALGGDGAFQSGRQQFQIRPAGNAVSLEDEMLKVATNQMDYQAATSLYTRSLGLIKTAIGQK
jgi:flagellar basal-body rod protein FlgB